MIDKQLPGRERSFSREGDFREILEENPKV